MRVIARHRGPARHRVGQGSVFFTYELHSLWVCEDGGLLEGQSVIPVEETARPRESTWSPDARLVLFRALEKAAAQEPCSTRRKPSLALAERSAHAVNAAACSLGLRGF